MKRSLTAVMLCLCIVASALNASAFDGKTKLLAPMSESYCELVYQQVSTEPGAEQTVVQSADVTIESGDFLYSLLDEPIAIFYQLSPLGYAIFDPVTGQVLEYSIESDHPFYNNRSEHYYYDGVMRYFVLRTDGFVNLRTGQIVQVQDRMVSDSEDMYHNSESQEQMRAIGTETSSVGRQLDETTRQYNCNTSSNFFTFYPHASIADYEGWPGVCGSLACATVVAYYDDHYPELAGDGDFATNSKKTSGSRSNNTYGIELVTEMVGYIEPSANGSVFLNGGMEDYLSDHPDHATTEVSCVFVQTLIVSEAFSPLAKVYCERIQSTDFQTGVIDAAIPILEKDTALVFTDSVQHKDGEPI